MSSSWIDKDSAKTVVGFVATGAMMLYVQSGSKFSWLTEKLPVLSKTKSLTIDLTALAKNGDLSRSFDVEQKIKILIAQLLGGNGFAFVVGSPGVGKSALIDELSCRIAGGKIRRLKNARILSLDMKAAFPSGIAAMMSDLASGGLSKAIETIVVHLGRVTAVGQKSILYIDEIQDFLEGNGDAFNNLKAELAKKNTHIIGASMNPEKVQKWIDAHFGMKRRTKTITLQPKEASEVISILEQSKALYLKEILREDTTISTENQTPRFDIDSSAIRACLFFAEQINPDTVDPARSISEFKQFIGLITDSRFDENQTTTITLSENDFLGYIRETQDNYSTLIARWETHKKKEARTQEAGSQLTPTTRMSSSEDLFPLITYSSGKPSELILEEGERLGKDLSENEGFVLRIFGCKVTALVGTIVEYATIYFSDTGLAIRHVSLENLRRLYNTSTNNKKLADQIRENLKRSSEGKRNILFIEDGQLLLPHLDEFKKTKVAPAPNDTSPFKANPVMAGAMGQMMKSMQNMSGTTTATSNTSEPKPEVTIHPVDQIFLDAIKKRDVEVLIVDTSNQTKELLSSPIKGRTLSTIKKKPIEPNAEQIFAWLSFLVYGNGRDKESDMVVKTIENLVDTFLWKEDPKSSTEDNGIQVSKGDLCFDLLQKWKDAPKTSRTEDARPLSPNSEVWGPLVESYDAWNLNPKIVTKHLESLKMTDPPTNKPQEEHPLSWIKNNTTNSVYLNWKTPETLRNTLSRFQKETKLHAPLWVGEDSPTLREYRQAQVASWLMVYGRQIHFFDSRVTLNALQGGVVFFEVEKIDPSGAQIEAAMKAGHKVVIFGKVNELPTSSQSSSIGMIEMAKSVIGGDMTSAAPVDLSPLAKMWPESITYAPKKLTSEDIEELKPKDRSKILGEISQLNKEGLTEKERATFLQFQIDMAYKATSRVKPEILIDLVNVYEHLWTSRNYNPDRISVEIRKDIPALKQTSEKSPHELTREDVIKYFSETCQAQLETTRNEVAYAIAPSLTSWSYRFGRFIGDGILYIKNFIIENIHWAISFIMSPFSSIFSFLKSPMMRFLPGAGQK